MKSIRKQLAEALVQLMLQTPYSKISIKAICEAVPTSRRTFYSYYDDKNSMLQAIIVKDFMDNAFPIIKSGLGEKGARAFFKYIHANRAFYKAACAINNGDFLFHCLMKAYGVAVENVLEYAHPINNNEKKINPDVYRLYTHSGIASIVVYWIKGDFTISTEDISRDTALVIEHPHSYVRDYYLL